MSIGTIASSFAAADQTVTETLQKVRTYVNSDAKDVSLPKFTKHSIINAPCFIERSVAEESVINDIIKNLYNVYVGYIICALEMTQYVHGGRRVRDVLNTVSTVGSFEAMNPFIDNQYLIEKLAGSMEGFSFSRTSEVNGAEETRQYTSEPSKNDYQVDKKINIPIASGRYINLTLSIGPNNATVNLPILVNINNRIIPSNVMEYVFSRDFNQSLLHRFVQLQAGEIRFIRDFILGIDKLDRRAEALKADKDNHLSEILRQQNKSKIKRVLQDQNNRSHNLANAIIIADEDTVKDITKKAGFNLERPVDRQRFFNTIYGLFIVLVDSRYSRVTIYTNGIDQSASYSYNDLKSSAASDKLSLKEVMDYLTKNQMPRF